MRPTTITSPGSSLYPTFPPSQNYVPRSTTRVIRPPTYLQQYVCNIVTTSSHSSTFIEPTTYKIANQDPCWVRAMEAELDALNTNNSWDLVPLPSGKKPIGSKWVYKVKLKADGSLERYKARIVAKGYTQEYGVIKKPSLSSSA